MARTKRPAIRDDPPPLVRRSNRRKAAVGGTSTRREPETVVLDDESIPSMIPPVQNPSDRPLEKPSSCTVEVAPVEETIDRPSVGITQAEGSSKSKAVVDEPPVGTVVYRRNRQKNPHSVSTSTNSLLSSRQNPRQTPMKSKMSRTPTIRPGLRVYRR